MSAWLSKNEINSFVGDVLPIKLLSDKDISKADILWSASDSEIVGIRTFEGDHPQSISDGAIVTLKKAGKAEIFAEFQGERYTCSVNVREMKHADEKSKLNYYIGDFHDHMAQTHDPKEFAERQDQLSIDYVRELKEKSDIDFSIISDHASVTNPRDFFKGFVDVEAELPMRTVIFAGSESEITVVEKDRFGIDYKKSGEIVSVNCDNYINAESFEEFYDAMSTSPFGICVFAHPYVLGRSVKGIWEFKTEKLTYEPFRSLMHGIEMGDGTDCESNMLYEAFYSRALDSGFRVSPTCASDGHKPPRGYDACPGKTVIMATNGEREALLDSLLNRRFYACESGNVKLYYTVNGKPAASEIKSASEYKFHIDISYFKEDETTVPKRLDVISNYGETVASFSDVDFTEFDFDVKYDDAAYFYLRFVDSEGRKTWSAPIFTDKSVKIKEQPKLTALDKSAFSVTELESGENAEILISGNPLDDWKSKLSAATYVIDMKKEHKISAVGHYTPYICFKELRAAGIDPRNIVAGFVSKYKLSLSLDGKEWKVVKRGKIRMYSGEENICFDTQSARYIKFEVISTAGKESDLEKYKDNPIIIAELSVFE